MDNPHIAIIVQARMGSTRLPNKVLKEVDGKPLLGLLLERLERVQHVHTCVVATTNDPLDDEIVEFCNGMGVPVERGEEDNVLDRYYMTAKVVQPNVIVRICADCPLLDPQIVDHVIDGFLEGDCDYASNVLERTYPRGMDVEVFSWRALEKAWRKAKTASEKEHVTQFFVNHPDDFRLKNVSNPKGQQNDFRLTVDTIEDFRLITQLLHILPPDFTLDDILATLQAHPDWAKINAHVVQKSV